MMLASAGRMSRTTKSGRFWSVTSTRVEPGAKPDASAYTDTTFEPSSSPSSSVRTATVAELAPAGIVTVAVGSVEHPMLPEHYIEWIAIKTKTGNQRKELKPGDAPKAVFAIVDGDEVEEVYAYCNLHSLWKA